VEQTLRARSAGAGPTARLGAVAFIHRFGSALNPHLHSVDASVRIEANDHAGRERLLRYCTRPPFALDRLRALDPERLLYDGAKPGPGGSGPLRLTPLQLIDRLAALIPPPRVHRHRYFGMLAPNSALRAAVTALAVPAVAPAVPLAAVAPAPHQAPPADEPAHRRAARYAWAVLLARIDEVLPLRCPNGGGEMRIIAFITATAVVRDILLALKRADCAPPPSRRPVVRRWGPQWTMPPATPRRVMRSPRTPSPHPHRTSSSISASPGSQASALARRPGAAWGRLAPAAAYRPHSARWRCGAGAIGPESCLGIAQTVGLRRPLAA